jgi:hypothetical protein
VAACMSGALRLKDFRIARGQRPLIDETIRRKAFPKKGHLSLSRMPFLLHPDASAFSGLVFPVWPAPPPNILLGQASSKPLSCPVPYASNTAGAVFFRSCFFRLLSSETAVHGA